MSVKVELQKRLTDWATTQSIPVAKENVPFTKPSSSTGKYLEVMFLNSSVITPHLAGLGEREFGIMQINVCVPQGQGAGPGDALVANVKTLYPVVPKTGTVSVERPVQVSQAFTRDDGFRVIPLTVYYRQER
jgi:hypothetical protein